MESESHKISLNFKGNHLTIDLKNGGKIISLLLSDQNGIQHKIITGESQGSFTANGSYLMFPWVNRIDPPIFPATSPEQITPDFLDNRGIALHGLFATCEREIISFSENYVEFKVKDYEKVYEKNNFASKMPKFIEKFILSDKGLTILTEFLPGDEDSEGFSYGYHPYVQLDDEEINGVQIETNMTHYIKLDEKQIPIPSPDNTYQLGDFKDLVGNKIIEKDIQLDHCFFNENYKMSTENYINFLFNSKGLGIVINDSEEIITSSGEKMKDYLHEKEKICLPYFQVYTPVDRKRIAIEPQNSGANSYHIHRQNLIAVKKGSKGKYGVINIFLKFFKTIKI